MFYRFLLVLTSLISFGCQTQAIDLNCKTASLRQEIDGYDLVLFGTLERPKDGEDPEWTDFRITQRLRTHDCIKGMDVIRIPRKVPPPGPNDPPGYLLFGKVSDGKPEVVGGGHATVALIDYFKGIFAIDAKDRVKTLRFAFDYLEHDEQLIAIEAYREFRDEPDDNLRAAAKGLKPEKLRKWIANERTWPESRALYASLLGWCGTASDAAILRLMIDRLVASDDTWKLDRSLIAYAILDPKAGWALTRELIANPKSEFQLRYYGFTTIRYFKDHPGVVAEKGILAGFGTILAQPDLAYLPIDELRRWKRWDLSDQIFALTDKEEFNKKIVRRSILCYALQCPDTRAAIYVTEQRKADPTWVVENEKWLKDEANAKK